MTNICLGLKRVKNDFPWYTITIHDIMEEYDECHLFNDALDLWMSGNLIKRIVLNNQVNVIVSSELKEHWNDCAR